MKPMKPASELIHPEDMKIWPKLVSVKLDGVRAVIKDGKVLSNSLKPIPNQFIQDELADLPDGLDGELTLLGQDGLDYNNNQSAVMSQSGTPNFVYNVFDTFDNPKLPYKTRAASLGGLRHRRVAVVPQLKFSTPESVTAYYSRTRERGYEGLILRDPGAIYKFGRSTLRQEYSLKMKPQDDDEAIIIDFTELYHNDNDPYDNELGYQRRSAHQENKVPGNLLGALVCSYEGQTFKIGTGFTLAQRKEIWDNRDVWKGLLVKFQHQGITKYGVPRGPAVFIGVRDERDL